MRIILFLIWVFVLFFELVWISTFTNRVHSTSDLFFSGAVVVVTIAVGFVGAITFKEQK